MWRKVGLICPEELEQNYVKILQANGVDVTGNICENLFNGC